MPNTKRHSVDEEFITLITSGTPDMLEQFANELDAACERGVFQEAEAIGRLSAYCRDKAQRIRAGEND